jgi:hypothetical protein
LKHHIIISLLPQELCRVLHGNDTIDPYPLIPEEAKKILCITDEIFKKIRTAYQAFCQGLRGRSLKRSLNLAPIRTNLLEQKLLNNKERHYSDYEPSKAIYVNNCDYRRWCRVKEWFNQYGPDAKC